MSSRTRKDLARRQALVEKTRHPAPLSYCLTPKNRKMRRALAKVLRRAEAKAD